MKLLWSILLDKLKLKEKDNYMDATKTDGTAEKLLSELPEWVRFLIRIKFPRIGKGASWYVADKSDPMRIEEKKR